MRILKILITAFLCSILIVNLVVVHPLQVFAGEENSFTGIRYIEFSVDKSDIDNFIDGGRAAFDLILRETAPDWIEYQISTEERDVVLSFKFEFTSYDDYCEKLSELLTYHPSIVYSANEDILLLESYSAMELLNFFQSILITRDCLNEKSLNEFFVLKKNEMTLNSTTYQSQERISIRPKNASVVKLDLLNINTISHEDGSFVRKIMVNINPNVSNSKDTIVSRFAEIGTTVENELSEDKMEISVEFTANNQNELIRKTMLCLRAASSITEKQSFLDEKIVNVERCEFFDLTSLLNENGQFNYSHTYPAYVSNITDNENDVYVSNLTVTAKNVSEIVCNYESGFKFSTIEISTDLSNFFGKMKRTITFTAPIDIASDYHDVIKKELQDRLVRGSKFDIYDDGCKRIYEITFSSFFLDEVSEFSNSVLNTNRTIHYNNSWIPYGKSSVNERLEYGNVLPDMVPPDESIVTYKLPVLSMISSEETALDNAEIDDLSVTFSVKSSDNINFEFRHLDIFKLPIVILPILAVIIVLLIYKKKK